MERLPQPPALPRRAHEPWAPSGVLWKADGRWQRLTLQGLGVPVHHTSPQVPEQGLASVPGRGPVRGVIVSDS